MLKRLGYYIGCMFLMTACVIENDIPLPLVDGVILSFEVEGQRAGINEQNKEAIIDKTKRTVTLFVNDSVNLAKLKIKKLEISDNATLVVDSSACLNPTFFPTTGFSSLSELSSAADTRVNFTQPVVFTVKTYQDYPWKVSVTQIIDRQIDVVNQVGDAIIDPYNRTAIIYVSEDQVLSNVTVNKMNLGGEYGSISPDPTTIKDFTSSQQFYVGYAWKETLEKWTVFVYHTVDKGLSANAFAMVTKATLTGKVQSGKTPIVEYKPQSDSKWSKATDVAVSGTSFTVNLTGLKASTSYQYRIGVDGEVGDEQTFTTADAIQLTDGSFDNWSKASDNDRLWQPWVSTSFWDTGNQGATTVGESNSYPTNETSNGSGKAAALESKYIVLKFAAGNIFTGSYKKTDGTNGILDFGRPFNSFPTKLRVNYKYNSTTINRVQEEMAHLKGRPDSCQIYIALTDWDQPLEIRTRPSNRQLFDPNDPKVIAYGTLIKGETVSSWTQADIELNYRYTNRTPKYILIVASSSKYGDYFTGGEGSKLWLDNCELIYD